MVAPPPRDDLSTSQQELDSAILDLLPAQGTWSEADYLWLTNHSNRLIELDNGYIEVLSMPTETHQAILKYLFRILDRLMEQVGGTVFFAALRLRIGPRKFREPDLLLLLDANDPRRGDAYWTGADLVVEVVSPDNPQRDTVKKRREYAAAQIPEYWIVNPASETITVLRLVGKHYVEYGIFTRGTTATSALIAGFSVAVSDTLDAR